MNFANTTTIGKALILFPAYGRTYDNHVSMRTDWEQGKDFRIYGGAYCSIRDIAELHARCATIYITDPITRIQLKL